MKVDVISIFPEYLDPVRQSLPGKAIESGIVDFCRARSASLTHDVHHWWTTPRTAAAPAW